MNSLHFIAGGALALIVILIAVFGFQTKTQPQFENSDFLRIHIRANSNSEIDQEVKYKVKADVVDYLTPLLVDAVDKHSAMRIVGAHLCDIEKVANKTLKNNGFDYKSTALLKQEEFPTRQYDDLTLESGVYDALILNLGSGSGNNWWCVVYPPLCFVGGQDDGSDKIQYRSKLVDIINKFFK